MAWRSTALQFSVPRALLGEDSGTFTARHPQACPHRAHAAHVLGTGHPAKGGLATSAAAPRSVALEGGSFMVCLLTVVDGPVLSPGGWADRTENALPVRVVFLETRHHAVVSLAGPLPEHAQRRADFRKGLSLLAQLQHLLLVRGQRTHDIFPQVFPVDALLLAAPGNVKRPAGRLIDVAHVG